MNARILIAGLLGGLAMFIWSAAAHMSPLGEIGIGTVAGEARVTEALNSETEGRAGLYVIPSDLEAPADRPSALVVFHPTNVIGSMPPGKLIGEVAKEILQALLLAVLIAGSTASGFSARMGIGAIAGIMVALTSNGSYWIWYGFLAGYTLAAMAIEFIAFVIAAGVIAKVLPHTPKTGTV